MRFFRLLEKFLTFDDFEDRYALLWLNGAR